MLLGGLRTYPGWSGLGLVFNVPGETFLTYAEVCLCSSALTAHVRAHLRANMGQLSTDVEVVRPR